MLSDTLGAGMFRQEETRSFSFRFHFETVDEFVEYMKEWYTNASIEPRYIERAREMMAAGGCEIEILEPVRATRYRRID